jgi:hypothetical protein
MKCSGSVSLPGNSLVSIALERLNRMTHANGWQDFVCPSHQAAQDMRHLADGKRSQVDTIEVSEV